MSDERIDMGSTEAVAWALHREIYPDLEVILRIEYDGEPVSKSRARFTGKGSKSRAYTPEKTRAAENRLVTLARQAGVRGEPDGEHTYGIFAKFFCGTWQRRDVDNMLKLVSDALTKIVWVDDSQVSEMSAAVQRGVDHARTYVLIYRTNARMNPTASCQKCGKRFKVYKSQAGRMYCSQECAGRAQRVRVVRTCRVCGQAFERKLSASNRQANDWCSRACRVAETNVEVPCDHCGQPVYRRVSQQKAKSYCGRDCFAAARRGKPRGAAK